LWEVPTRITEIHPSIKFLKGLQKNVNFSGYWCCNKIADYLAKNGTKISQTSACKLTFHFARLRIKEPLMLTYWNIIPFKASINPGTK
jgi:hypothetical protein